MSMDPPPYSQLGAQPQVVVGQPYYQQQPAMIVGAPQVYAPPQMQPQVVYQQQPQTMYVPVVYQQQPQQQQPQQMAPAAAAQPVTNNNTNVVVVQQQKDPLALGQDAAATILRGGLCACLDDIPSCLCACLLPMCQNGMTAASVEIGNCLYCTVCYAFFPCCTGAVVRSKLHERAGLQDPGFVNGCFTHCCCMCCAVAQEARAASKLKAANTLMSR